MERKHEDGDTEGGAPVTLLEAQASGMPVVSTLHADIPEVVPNHQSGFLVPERDAPAIADRVIYLIKNHTLWAKLGSSGRKFVEENYNVFNQNKSLENIYSELINEAVF